MAGLRARGAIQRSSWSNAGSKFSLWGEKGPMPLSADNISASHRSTGVNLGRFLAERCSTPTWWRRARFSELKGSARTEDRGQSDEYCRERNEHRRRIMKEV